MAKYTYDDIVMVRKDAPLEFRPGDKAWVIAIHEDRPGNKRWGYPDLPEGVVYLVEFEGGDAIGVHESNLEPVDDFT